MRTTIIGGGIAGLSTAIGLARVGIDVTVVERARQFGEAGSALSVWPNALRALDALGVGEQVRRRSREAVRPVIRDSDGRSLSATDVPELERRFGPLLMIHRADLLDVLADALPSNVRLRLGVAVEAVAADGTVVDSAGTTGAGLVVGADGVNSTVRAGLWPEARRPRYLGYSAYRMLTDPTDLAEEGETWGRGQRFGYAPLHDGRVYCFAVVNATPGQAPHDLSGLRDRFGGWHAPIPELLGAVPPSAVLYHDLYELPPLPAYTRGHVALVGDAAHAMAPNLGQGAGQAVEDAAVLTAAVAATPSITSALSAYDQLRRARTQAITVRSRRVGVVAQQQAAAIVAVRNALLRWTPDRALLASLATVLSWQPPSIGARAGQGGEGDITANEARTPGAGAGWPA